MQFTPTEWMIIKHRLDVPDAVADAITENSGYSYESIFNRIDEIGRLGRFDIFDNLDKEILKECCDGSTFFADLDDEVAFGNISKGKKMAYYKAAYSLEEKLGVEVCKI